MCHKQPWSTGAWYFVYAWIQKLRKFLSAYSRDKVTMFKSCFFYHCRIIINAWCSCGVSWYHAAICRDSSPEVLYAWTGNSPLLTVFLVNKIKLMHTCMCVCAYVYMRMCICIYVCMFVCMCICMYICMYVCRCEYWKMGSFYFTLLFSFLTVRKLWNLALA